MPTTRRRAFTGLALAVTGLLLIPASAHGQHYSDFTTPVPLPGDHVLVIGFLGGRDDWDDDRRSLRRLALRLRAMRLQGVHVETVQNTRRDVALRLVREAFDRNRDGQLAPSEKAAARLIVFGQSFGGAAVVKFARQLHALGVPILLTVQIDSVGRGDGIIPPNVRRAANLYQHEGLVIEGEAPIVAEDPQKTEILGNFLYVYKDKNIDLSHETWWRKIFRVPHLKMENDPEVWAHVERLILDEVHRLRLPSKDSTAGP
jgi:hypothetical protein